MLTYFGKYTSELKHPFEFVIIDIEAEVLFFYYNLRI